MDSIRQIDGIVRRLWTHWIRWTNFYLFVFLIKTKYGSYVSNRYQIQLQKPRYKEQLTAQTKNKKLQKQQAQGTKPEN